jgi:hypothetical protein
MRPLMWWSRTLHGAGALLCNEVLLLDDTGELLPEAALSLRTARLQAYVRPDPRTQGAPDTHHPDS